MNAPASAPSAGRVLPSPPTQARVLLPVWGGTFVRQFLDFGLPTLLAPGNLPAVAARLPTSFIVLTRERDRATVARHPATRELAVTCRTEVRSIDHLINRSNHSTTVTLAYAEAVRAEGRALTDTCFFFLVSDYLMADGSLANVLERVLNGASAVQAGNFQVAQEAARAWLRGIPKQSPARLSIGPRRLMHWGLRHLHPVTIASIVNQPLSHADPANRLFWRVDAETLLGRFYLLHMIAIRPTTADFAIGSSCDYSFVPEMSIGGRVETITDSDEYLVLEMQPRGHEGAFVRAGPLRERRLARSLAEWTTARHRANAAVSILYHAGEPDPEAVGRAAHDADRLVARVAARLSPRPCAHRDHPYWAGAIASFKEATGQPLSQAERRLALGLPHPALAPRWMRAWMVAAADRLLHGGRSGVRPWHPRWPEYRRVAALLPAWRENGRRLLLLSDAPTVLSVTLPDGGVRIARVQASRLTESFSSLAPALGRFDGCLIEVMDDGLATLGPTLDCAARLVGSGGRLLVLVQNRFGLPRDRLRPAMADHAALLIRPWASEPGLEFIPAGRLRWKAARSLSRRLAAARHSPVSGLPVLALAAPPLGIAMLLGNLLSLLAGRPHARGASAGLVTLTVRHAVARSAETRTGKAEAGRDQPGAPAQAIAAEEAAVS